jgi:hypothetical protein
MCSDGALLFRGSMAHSSSAAYSTVFAVAGVRRAAVQEATVQQYNYFSKCSYLFVFV